MADTPGPIYTGAGIPLKGFAPLLEATANAAAIRQRNALSFQKAREAQQNRIESTLKNVYNESGQDLAPGLQPFWGEYVDGLSQQLENMTFRSGEPIETLSDGLKLVREANAFYDELYGYNHFQGEHVQEDQVKYLNTLIGNPKKIADLEKNSPVDKIYNLYDEKKANSELAQMQAYAGYGFMGVKTEQFADGTYINGGYKNHGRIDYSTGIPQMVITKPNGIADSSTGGTIGGDTYLKGLPIYGPNNSALFSVERFATDRAAMELEALGQEYLQPLVETDRKGLGWSEEFAKQHIDSVLKDPSKIGQNTRYAIGKKYMEGYSNFLNEEEFRAFIYNAPEMAYGKNEQGESLATPNQITELKRKFQLIFGDDDMRREIIKGSNYDRLIPTEAKADERQKGLENTLNTMTRTNPNEIFALDEIDGMIDRGVILMGQSEADAFNHVYARLLAKNFATLGGEISPDMPFSDILMTSAPSFAMVGQQVDQDAGVTRKFIENFESGKSHLPQTIGNFAINASGSSQFQFSPQDGVEGGIDNVFFTRDDGGSLMIGVSLNKSGVQGFGISANQKPIEPIQGSVKLQAGDPYFSIGQEADGSNYLIDEGRILPSSALLNQVYETGSPDLVFKFDPNNSDDKFRLEQLGSKLDDFYGVRGKKFPNSVNESFGYTLNAMFSKVIQ